MSLDSPMDYPVQLAAISYGDWKPPPLKDATGQIRLLSFRPSSVDDDDEIDVDLEVFDLESAPEFTAISYTWGEEPPQQFLKINNLQVTVRPNCHYALWQTRHQFPDIWVWLDAICINQDDLDEKASQVAIMGDIYEKADRVLACIGPDDDCSDTIRYALENLDEFVQDLPWKWSAKLDMSVWDPPLDKELTWEDLIDLDFRIFKLFLRTDSPYERESSGCNIINRINSLLRLRSGSSDVEQLLMQLRHFQCHDVRDRIFGTLRVADWTQFARSVPVPDYQISSLQLAFDLVELIDPHDLGTLWHLVQALNLEQANFAFQELLRKRERAENRPTSSKSKDRVTRYTNTLAGAHIVQRDKRGRLTIDLDGGSRSEPLPFAVPEVLNLPTGRPENLETVLVTNGLTAIYTDDEVSVLANGETQPGDIIVLDTCTDLVLRAEDDGLSFRVVGQALVVNGFEATQKHGRSDCICWTEETQERNYHPHILTIEFEISHEDALVAVTSRLALESGNVAMMAYLEHHSLGKLIKGSRVYDISLADVDTEQFVGPPKALCEMHQLSEQYRISRQALWYAIQTRNGAYVYVKK